MDFFFQFFIVCDFTKHIILYTASGRIHKMNIFLCLSTKRHQNFLLIAIVIFGERKKNSKLADDTDMRYTTCYKVFSHVVPFFAGNCTWMERLYNYPRRTFVGERFLNIHVLCLYPSAIGTGLMSSVYS